MAKDFFDNCITIPNPIKYEGQKEDDKIQVALEPIGPATLGDLKFNTLRGVYTPDTKNVHIATLPELVSFLSYIQENDNALYQNYFGLTEKSPNPSNIDSTVKALMEGSSFGDSFMQREASHEGNNLGIAIAANTVMNLDRQRGNSSLARNRQYRKSFLVKDRPDMRFCNFDASFEPESIDSTIQERYDSRIYFNKLSDRVTEYDEYGGGHTRIFTDVTKEDLESNMKESLYTKNSSKWTGDFLLTLTGSHEIADKAKGLEGLSISPLCSDYLTVTSPGTTVATIRKEEDANIYIGGYYREKNQKYYAFLVRNVE